MNSAYVQPWPGFGDGGRHPGWRLVQRLRTAGGRAGGRGRFGGNGWPGPPGPGGGFKALMMAGGRGGGRGGPWGRGGPPGLWGGPWRGGFGPPPGPKVRRGDVRASILALLAEEPRNGYQIIQEIEERSGGVWRPSAGSVYPALQQLEDEGLVLSVQDGTRRLYQLTDEGRTHADTTASEQGAPWEALAEGVDEGATEIHELAKEVAMAAVQVARAGSASQLNEARRVLKDTRRSLYRVLAEDGPEDTD
ncbi:PadR family transcriptional regulator [Halostreptopolyspora alba]|uniref:PadR family transcriptional regulator n=1 Tax=Halostreptopolyspora alba TaxID=2487137 RepID=A0A3N0EI62_9ACTN|nr:PadR family transcriptional regulator [Nocardiopsaceae bacterium YIM 96095]